MFTSTTATIISSFFSIVIIFKFSTMIIEKTVHLIKSAK